MARDYKLPMCNKCKLDHYNFQACPPREDLKPASWSMNDGWISDLDGLKHNGGNTFLNRREGER